MFTLIHRSRGNPDRFFRNMMKWQEENRNFQYIVCLDHHDPDIKYYLNYIAQYGLDNLEVISEWIPPRELKEFASYKKVMIVDDSFEPVKIVGL